MTDKSFNLTRSSRIIETSNDELELVALWVIESRSGDRRAFKNLYLKFYRRLYLFCLRMTVNARDAEDMVQDTFIKAWIALPTFRQQSQFYTWLRAIALRVLIDKKRSKENKIWDNNQEYDVNDHRSHVTAEAQIDLERFIRLLPEGARNVLVLHDLEGYSHPEIAKMFSIAVGTSKAQLSRARKLLRLKLTDSISNRTEERVSG